MGTFRAISLATPDHLLTHADLGLMARLRDSASLQLGAREYLETPQTVFVEIFHRVEKIAVEGHLRWATGSPLLGHMNRGEQPCDRPPVGQGPAVRRRHPVRMVGAQRVPVRLRRVYQVVEPDSAVPVVERHDRVRGRTTPGAADCHRRNARSREICIQGPRGLPRTVSALSGRPGQSTPDPSTSTIRVPGTPSTPSS